MSFAEIMCVIRPPVQTATVHFATRRADGTAVALKSFSLASLHAAPLGSEALRSEVEAPAPT